MATAGSGSGSGESEGLPAGFDPEGPESTEYYYLQDMIFKFNDHCFETKKWSVALTSAAAIFSGFTSGSAAVSALIIFVLAVAFWATEAVWRANQFAFIRRVRELESRLADSASPRISYRWHRYANGAAAATSPADWNVAKGETTWRGIFGHFKDRRTALPHIVIAAVALAGLIAITACKWLGGEPTEEPVATMEVSVLANGAVSVERAD
jgi:hypothetical protein